MTFYQGYSNRRHDWVAMDLDSRITSGHIYRMPFGYISILATDKGIASIEFLLKDQAPDNIASLEPSALTNKCAEELLEYLSGKRSVFDVPIDVKGTEFQMQVWDAISQIPYSQTRTVRQLAESIGKPKSYRSVGTAESQNPVPILIPAHRVVSTSEDMTNSRNGALRAAFRKLEAST